MNLSEYLFIVAARVNPEVERDWNNWYNDVHLPEITGCPGFIRSARYVHEEEGSRNYLAVYEIAGPEALTTPEFRSRRGWAHFAPHVEAKTYVYRRIDKREGADG